MANSIKVAIDLEGKDALNTIKALEKGITKLGQQGEKSIGGMTGALQVFQGVVGAQVLLKSLDLTSRALQQGAKDALDFGKAIAEINSIAPRTATETLALKQQLIGLSNEFGGEAQKQARAFYNIVSAGVKETANQLNVLETANRAAVAGLVDIDTSARVLVASVNSYAQAGLTAGEASDILFNTVREGITTFGELSSSIGTVAPLAASAGVEFSELGGALAFLTKSGISTAEAATGIRAVLTGVIKPSQEAATFARQLGLEFNTAAIKSKGFANFLKDVIDRTGGAETELAKLFPNVRALGPIVQIAAGNFEEFVRILDNTANSAGATDKAFQTITDSAAFQFEKLTNQLRNFPTALLTNFEEPLSDGLKAVNEFVGAQGILLLVDAIDGVLEAFQTMNAVGSEVDQFFNFIAGSVLDTAKAWKEFVLSVNSARIAFNEFTGDAAEAEMLKKQEEQLRKNIDVLDQAIIANQQATVKIQQEEAKRFKVAEDFRKKLEEGRKQQIAGEDARREEEAKKDEEAAKNKLNSALQAEQKQFNAIQELKAANKELEAEQAEEEKLAKELATEEEFLFLEENLGRQNALKELNRIQDIESEKKRQVELKKLRAKAQKEEEASILSIRKFEDLSNREKIAAQKQTLSTIASLGQSNNATLFAIGKAASLSLAGINVAEGVTKALSAFPPPFNFAAASAVGAAGAIQISKIASAKPPSAGSFQSGGIVEGASQTGDQLTANVNGGEAIFNRRQQQNLFNAVNDGSIGGGANNITINSQSLDGTIPQESIDSLIDQINDRTEFGNKNLGVA